MNHIFDVALCVPAYKAEGFLPKLLQSAAIQDPPFSEVIVCVDASPDRSAEVAAALGARVLVNDKNIGCSASKNRAFKEANAKWIHFHDADDLLLPNFTRLASTWMSKSDCPDVVLFNYEYRDHKTNELISLSDFCPFQLQTDPLRYAILNQINPFCGLYRKSKLEEVGGYDVDPEILYNEDVAFHCKLAQEGLSFSAEKEVSIINLRVAGSMSSANQVKCLKAHHAVMRRLAGDAITKQRYAKEIAHRLWVAATGLAVHAEWAEVDHALSLALELDYGVPDGNGHLFSLLCKITGPRQAFRIRERMIRILKSHLREFQ